MFGANLSKRAKLMGWVVGLLSVIGLCVFLASKGEPGEIDCVWDGVALAWLDENENGLWDEGEAPLSGVPFFAEDRLIGAKNVPRDWVMSNMRGEAHLSVWLPGCPHVKFDVYPEVPSSYRLTTKDRLGDSKALSGTYAFGFTYLPGAPTATPRPSAPIDCSVYPWDLYQYGILENIAITSKGVVWGATHSSIFQFDPASSAWSPFIQNIDPSASKTRIKWLIIDSDDTVWVGATDHLASFDGSSWITYPIGADSTPGGIDQQIIEPNGKIWRVSNEGVTKYGVAMPDGSLWVTDNFYLSRLPPAQDANISSNWIVYDHPSYEVFDIGDIAGSVDGTLWFRGRNREGGWGLANFDPATEKWAIYDPRTTHGALLGDWIGFFAVGPDGSVWVDACRNGLIQLVPAQGGQVDHAQIIYHTPDALRDKEFLNIALAPDGSVWLGTMYSLIHCTLGDGQVP